MKPSYTNQWDQLPNSSRTQTHAAGNAAAPRRMDKTDGIFKFSFKTDSVREASLVSPESLDRSLWSTLQASQNYNPFQPLVDISPVPPPAYDLNPPREGVCETDRNNPFPIEFGRKRDATSKAATPKHQALAPTPPLTGRSVSSSSRVNVMSATATHNPSGVVGTRDIGSVSAAGFPEMFGGSSLIPVPDGLGTIRYRAPDLDSLVFDRNSGYRFDPTTGLHYDANSGFFINLRLQVFLRWDPLSNTYLRIDNLSGLAPSIGQLPGSLALIPNAPTLTSGLPTSSTLNPSPIPATVLPAIGVQPNTTLRGTKPSLNLIGQPSLAATSGVQAEVLDQASSLKQKTLEDSFMLEMWERMKLMAKEVIDDREMTQDSSDDDTKLSKKYYRYPRSSSNSSGVSNSPERLRKKSRYSPSDIEPLQSRGRSREVKGNRTPPKLRRRRRSVSRSRNRSRSLSVGVEQKRIPSRDRRKRRRRSSSRSRNRSWSHSRGGNTSRTPQKDSGRWRGRRRSRPRNRSRSVIRRSSRSRGRETRRSHSRSPTWRERRYRGTSPSLSQFEKREFSRYERRGRRSRSISQQRRVGRGDEDDLERYTKKATKGEVKDVLVSWRESPERQLTSSRDKFGEKRRKIGSKSKDDESERENPRLMKERTGLDGDPRSIIPRAKESADAAPQGNVDLPADDSDGASEFDFLKETLDEDNESVIVDEYEEILDYDEHPGNRVEKQSESTLQNVVIPVEVVVDDGDVFGHLFSNDSPPTNIVVVAPVSLKAVEGNKKILKNEIPESNLIRLVMCASKSFGSSHNYMLILFRDVDTAKQFYDKHNGALVLSGGDKTKMKGYLYFSSIENWECCHCHTLNFPVRSSCHICYHLKKDGSSLVCVSKVPTKWVGVAGLQSCYKSTDEVLNSLPPLDNFKIRGVQMLKEPSGSPSGLCILEVRSSAEGMALYDFFQKNSMRTVFVVVNGDSDKMSNDLIKPAQSGVLAEKVVDDAVTDGSGVVSSAKTHISHPKNNKNLNVEDVLAPLLSTSKTTDVIMIAPIRLSKIPYKLKLELSKTQTFLKILLDSDNAKYNGITLHMGKSLGVPFNYGLIHFSGSKAAADWCGIHSNALNIDIGRLSIPRLKGVAYKASLYAGQQNWDCHDCRYPNFPLRSLCHHCFLHRKKDQLSPITQSTNITRWVATSVLPNMTDDGLIDTHFRSYLKDFKLGSLKILRDPECPALPQGCVFETQGVGESLRLRELLQRTGRLAVFVIINEGPVASPFLRNPRVPINPDAPQHEIPSLIREEGNGKSDSNRVVLDVEVVVQNSGPSDSSMSYDEPAPDELTETCLSWWKEDAEKVSDVLNYYFLENPSTRTSHGKTIFVGPLPIPCQDSTIIGSLFQNILDCKLREDESQYSLMTIHIGSRIGAPCSYGLVSFATTRNAEAWHGKHKNGLILPFASQHSSNKQSCTTSSLGEKSHFKTYLYYSEWNWQCNFCKKFNFCLRSNCFWCFNSKSQLLSPITISRTPTQWVGLRTFEYWSNTEAILLANLPPQRTVEKLKNLRFAKEESGVPLLLCVVNTGDPSEGLQLFNKLVYKFPPDRVVFICQSKIALPKKGRNCAVLENNDKVTCEPELPSPVDKIGCTVDRAGSSPSKKLGVLENNDKVTCGPELPSAEQKSDLTVDRTGSSSHNNKLGEEKKERGSVRSSLRVVCSPASRGNIHESFPNKDSVRCSVWWKGNYETYCDVLKFLFVENPMTRTTPDQVIFAGPLPITGHDGSMVPLWQNVLQRQLEEDNVQFSLVKIHYGCNMGAPCSYALVYCKSADHAEAWLQKHEGGLILPNIQPQFCDRPPDHTPPLEGEGSPFKTFLFYSKRNWCCLHCTTNNWGLRSVCFFCFKSKDHCPAVPFKISVEPTRWVCVRGFQDWCVTEEALFEKHPFLRTDERLKNVSFPKEESGVPLGACVLETRNSDDGQQLLAEFPYKVAVYVDMCPSDTLVCSSPCVDKKSQRTEEPEPNMPSTNAVIKEIEPQCPLSKSRLLWWKKGADTFSAVLNYLFLENPMTKTSPGTTVLVGPLPIAGKRGKTNHVIFKRILESILYVQDHLKCADIVIHSVWGAPCSYGLVTFNSVQDAETWHNKYKEGLIVSRSPTILQNPFKAFLYYSPKNWTCKGCLKSNFGLRSNCFACYQSRQKHPPPLTICKHPTKSVCIQDFRPWSRTKEHLLRKHPFLRNYEHLKNIHFPQEASGIPLGVCVLETANPAEGKALFDKLSSRKAGNFLAYAEFSYTVSSDQARGYGSEPSLPGFQNFPSSSNALSKKREDGAPRHLMDSLVSPSPCTPELVPDSQSKPYLSWWVEDFKTYFDILDNLFVKNPVSRYSPCETVFFGPLPKLSLRQCTRSIGLTFQKIVGSRLKEDNLRCHSISIHSGTFMGAPCSYGLVYFKTTRLAEAWLKKRQGVLILPNLQPENTKAQRTTSATEGRPFFKVYLYYSSRNWSCSVCSKLNFGLRSHCFSCFKSKNEKPDLMVASKVPTRWICIQGFQDWCATEDTLLTRYPILKTSTDVKRIGFLKEESGIPLGVCVIETRSSIKSKKLSSIFPKAGVVYVNMTSSGISSLGESLNHSRSLETDVWESRPNSNALGSLYWWKIGAEKYSDILQYLFVENPLTRTTPGSTVLIGALPLSHCVPGPYATSLKDAIELKLREDGVVNTDISIHLGQNVGAPCNYGLVTFKSMHEAEMWHGKHEGVLILSLKLAKKFKSYKTFLYYSTTNWNCQGCDKSNFGLRSNCFACYQSRYGHTPPLSLSTKPTNSVIIKGFQHWCGSKHLLLDKLPILQSCTELKTIRFLYEESGIPIGVCVLHTENPSDGCKLFTKFSKTRAHSFMAYAIVEDSACGPSIELGRCGTSFSCPQKMDGCGLTGQSDHHSSVDDKLITIPRCSSVPRCGKELTDTSPTSIILVSPIIGLAENASEFLAKTFSNDEADLVEVESCNGDVFGVPFNYCLVRFDSPSSAMKCFAKCCGRIELTEKVSPDQVTGTQPSPAFLHFVDGNWTCDCGKKNFPFRALCFRCLRMKKSKEAPFEISPVPTRWVVARVGSTKKVSDFRRKNYNALQVVNSRFLKDFPLSSFLKKLRPVYEYRAWCIVLETKSIEASEYLYKCCQKKFCQKTVCNLRDAVISADYVVMKELRVMDPIGACIGGFTIGLAQQKSANPKCSETLKKLSKEEIVLRYSGPQLIESHMDCSVSQKEQEETEFLKPTPEGSVLPSIMPMDTSEPNALQEQRVSTMPTPIDSMETVPEVVEHVGEMDEMECEPPKIICDGSSDQKGDIACVDKVLAGNESHKAVVVGSDGQAELLIVPIVQPMETMTPNDPEKVSGEDVETAESPMSIEENKSHSPRILPEDGSHPITDSIESLGKGEAHKTVEDSAAVSGTSVESSNAIPKRPDSLEAPKHPDGPLGATPTFHEDLKLVTDPVSVDDCTPPGEEASDPETDCADECRPSENDDAVEGSSPMNLETASGPSRPEFIIVAPIPDKPGSKPFGKLRTQLSNSLTKDGAEFGKILLEKSLMTGAPWNYFLVHFSSPDAAKTWHEKRGGQITLKWGVKESSGFTASLTIGEANWLCTCKSVNYYLRSYCHSCFEAKAPSGFSPVVLSTTPTLWVGIRPKSYLSDVSEYVENLETILSQRDDQWSADDHLLRKVKYYTDSALGSEDKFGVCVFETSSLEDATKLKSSFPAKYCSVFVTPTPNSD